MRSFWKRLRTGCELLEVGAVGGVVLCAPTEAAHCAWVQGRGTVWDVAVWYASVVCGTDGTVLGVGRARGFLPLACEEFV